MLEIGGRAYYVEHIQRIKHTIKIINQYSTDLEKIGIVGCSIFDQVFKDFFKKKIFYNLMPPKLIELAEDKKYTIECDLERNSIEFSPPNLLFDGIIFTEVLEHMFFNDIEIMKNVSKLLRQGGYLFFSVPNVSALGKIIHLSVGTNPYMTKEKQINGVYGGYGHIREYSLKEAKKLVSSANLEIISVIGLNDYKNIFNKVAKLLPKLYAETIMVIGKNLNQNYKVDS
ncbi:MAG: methyltransferase domain-containing protein [Thermoplasmatales archaeon]